MTLRSHKFYRRSVWIWCAFTLMSIVIFSTSVHAQDIHKQLSSAQKASRSLQWVATDLYQKVLDNPAFGTLSLAEKLNVYDGLGWLYYVQEEYERAEPICEARVRLRENSEANTSVKKKDLYYVSNKSNWYVEALRWLAQTQLALGKYKRSENTFKMAVEADDKFNKGGGAFRWEMFVGWGRSYYLDGNFDMAIPLYEQAIALTPSFFCDSHTECRGSWRTRKYL